MNKQKTNYCYLLVREEETGWVDHKRTQNKIPKMYKEAA
jgi:hypothetical protein